MGEEELFEGGVFRRDREGEFRLAEMEGKTFGEGRSLADGFLDDVGEFGGVGSGEDQSLAKARYEFCGRLPRRGCRRRCVGSAT